jgi:hypothetical protein
VTLMERMNKVRCHLIFLQVLVLTFTFDYAGSRCVLKMDHHFFFGMIAHR